MAAYNLPVLISLLVGLRWTAASSLTFTNNGYDNLLVAISDVVEEDLTVIDELKSMITSASAFLHTATKRKAYFRSAKILVPRNWTRQAGWLAAQGQSLEQADIRVDSASPLHGHTPYTFQPGQCGEPGHFIHLTPKFVSNVTFRNVTYGDAGKLLVHEFAHLRFGVFDEYGFGDRRYPFFYLDDNRIVRPTGCTDAVRGRLASKSTGEQCVMDATTNLPQGDCMFFPDPVTSTARASVMFQQAAGAVDQFCDNSRTDSIRHSRNAPNLHNAKCNKMPTWSILSRHADLENTASRYVSYTEPTFIILQESQEEEEHCSYRGVLVMDVSGSMDESRLSKQAQTASNIIDSVPKDTRLALVKFSTDAQVVHGLLKLSTPADRELLKSRVPRVAEGWTAIGKGILKSLEVLKSDGNISSNDHIFLTTDGGENQTPFVFQILNETIATGVHVHTLAYSDSAAAILSNLSSLTGGHYEYFDEAIISSALEAAAIRIAELMTKCKKDVRIEVNRDAVYLSGSATSVNKTFFIDETLGEQLTYTFTLAKDLQAEISLTSPSGRVFDKTSPGTVYQHDSRNNIIRILIQEAEPGLWHCGISSVPGSKPGAVVVSLQGQRGVGSSSIELNTWTTPQQNDIATGRQRPPILYAHVHQGYAPLLRANVTVRISSSQQSPETRELKDDGEDPDTRAEDGVYTTYFTQTRPGTRHALDVSVMAVSGQTSLLLLGGHHSGALPLVPVPPVTTVSKPIELLTRTSSAGAVDVKDYDGTDRIPPGRITDLRVLAADASSHTATLAWTAPGDDLRQGVVNKTELRVGHSYEALTNCPPCVVVTSDMLINGSVAPVPAGHGHEVTVSLNGSLISWEAEVYVLGVVAYDEVNQPSDMSNLVVVTFHTVSFPPNIEEPPPVVATTTTEITTTEMTTTEMTTTEMTTTETTTTEIEMSTTSFDEETTTTEMMPETSKNVAVEQLYSVVADLYKALLKPVGDMIKLIRM